MVFKQKKNFIELETRGVEFSMKGGFMENSIKKQKAKRTAFFSREIVPYLTSMTTFVCQTTILNKLNIVQCEYVFEAVIS